MGFFSFLTKEIAIDLGTANTVIIYRDQVVIDEPSIIALDNTTGKVVAVGKQALRMHGKTSSAIRTVRPLKDGVIADFQSAECMLREFIRMVSPAGKQLFAPALKLVVCIPSGITEVEERAVKDSAEQAGAKEIRMIYEPMAAAIGMGIDVLQPSGNLVIDIGGGTSEIAVISMGSIVNQKSIKTAGDEFNEDIIDYVRKKHNIAIGESTAEQIKINVGAVIPDLDNPPEDYEAFGRDLLAGIPKSIKISYQEMVVALDRSITKIETAVINALESTPPELSADIFKNGIYIAGGGALLRGLDRRISNRTKLNVMIADDPLKAVARGTGIALKNFDKFQFLIDKKLD